MSIPAPSCSSYFCRVSALTLNFSGRGGLTVRWPKSIRLPHARPRLSKDVDRCRCRGAGFLRGGGRELSLFWRRGRFPERRLAGAFAQLRDDVGALSRVVRPDAPRLTDDPDDRPREEKDEHVRASVEDLEKELARTCRKYRRFGRGGSGVAGSGERSRRHYKRICFQPVGSDDQWKAPPGTTCRSLRVTNEGPSLAGDVRVSWMEKPGRPRRANSSPASSIPP